MKERSQEDGFTHFRWRVTNGIGCLFLDHPPSNQMNNAFFGELGKMIPVIRRESGLKGVILTGAGRHFSSGADLDDLLGTRNRITFESMHRNHQLMASFEEMDVPVVAAIRGVCIGSAFELAMMCHFRICAEDSVLGLPESTFNLMPGLGGVRNIARLAGRAKALELVLRGSTFDAADALGYGLADLVVHRKELMLNAVSLIEFVSGEYYRHKRSLYILRYIDKYVTLPSQTL